MKKDSIAQTPKVVHIRKSTYDVLIDRTTKWGNPFRLDHIITEENAIVLDDMTLVGKQVTRDNCINLYKYYLQNNKELLKCLHELDGKILGCWCSPKRCHGDAIIEVFIEETNKELFEF